MEEQIKINADPAMDPATLAALAKIISDILMVLFLSVRKTEGMTDAEKQALWEVEKAKTDAGVQRLLDIAAGKV